MIVSVVAHVEVSLATLACTIPGQASNCPMSDVNELVCPIWAVLTH